MNADFNNPTALRLGMTGTLAGKSYRVAGRVVMGMEEDGERYFWNEFNIINDEGNSAALVFEDSERGAEWKLFIYLEPDERMTASEAAMKRVADRVTIEGINARVSLVDESRVFFIEGEAPEGIEVGDVANYFNAESGNATLVVSWTGDEVEYYRGVNLPGGTVAQAFGIQERPSVNMRKAASYYEGGGDDSYTSKLQHMLGVLLVLIVAAVFFSQMPSCHFSQTPRAVTKISAPRSSLSLGDTGRLAAVNWTVRSHSIVQVSEVGRTHGRHEYILVDDQGNDSLLIHGMKAGEDDWFLFHALAPLDTLRAKQAAAMRVGDAVNVDGVDVRISEIFQEVVNTSEANTKNDAKRMVGDLMFGFAGSSSTHTLLVRWNDSTIAYWNGSHLINNEVTEGFRRIGK